MESNKNYEMDMDMDAIDRQDEELNKNSDQRSTKKITLDTRNYLDTRLKKGETKKTITVRILPVSAENRTPFFVLKTHSLKVDKEVNESGFKSFICLNDENVNGKNKCPLCAKADEYWKLYNEAATEAEKKYYKDKAKEFFSKVTFICRVIERGKEDEGVKFWRFNYHFDKTGCRDQLMNLYRQRKEEEYQYDGTENYNIFSLVDGKDFILTITPSSTGRGTTITISDAGRKTPLTNDPVKFKEWVEDPKQWNDVYSVKNADYLSIIAEGKVPFFDKEQNKYVAKVNESEADKRNEEEKNVKETSEALKETQKDFTHEEDLPF